jgi:hypothetical protein
VDVKDLDEKATLLLRIFCTSYIEAQSFVSSPPCRKTMKSCLFTLLLLPMAVQPRLLLTEEEELFFPDFRYLTWEELDMESETNALILDYNETTWNLPGTNDIELKSYFSINLTFPEEHITAVDDLGFNEETWDCWINHYMDYDWDELEFYNISESSELLGWDQSSWESGNPEDWPDTEMTAWVNLTASEQFGAMELCYFEELWDDVPLTDWVFESESPTVSSIAPSVSPSSSVPPSVSLTPSVVEVPTPSTKAPTAAPTMLSTDAPTASSSEAPTSASSRSLSWMMSLLLCLGFAVAHAM